jgi:hypothetical protein
MALKEAMIAAFVGAPIYDWIVVSGAAAKMVSLEYQYWPLTRLRIVSLALLEVGGFFTFLLPETDDRLWVAIPLFAAMALHCVVAMHDLFRQRRLAIEKADRQLTPHSRHSRHSHLF